MDRLPRVRAYLASTPWAIDPSTLAEIMQLVSYRSQGHAFTAEEIQARIGGRPQPSVKATGGVAVLPLSGVLVPKANLMTEISGGGSLEQFTQDLRAAAADETVSAIVLDIDSPGGSTDLASETAAEIRKAAAVKPVIAVANTKALSLAYWLGSQATEFVASPSAQVGSVGVIAAHKDITAMQEKLGVKTTLITAGEFKAELNPLQPLTEEGRAHVQGIVNQMYAQFTGDVARGRNVSAQDVRDNYGQGRILTAQDALRAGMIDKIATLDQTLARTVGSQPARRRGSRAENTLVVNADAGPLELESFSGTLVFDVDALQEVCGPIAPHSTPTDDAPWNGDAMEARIPNDAGAKTLSRMYAWVDDNADPATKQAYRFKHHEVSEQGEIGAANLRACTTGISVLNGARGGTTIPDADRQGVWDHLAAHIRDAGREPAPLKSLAELAHQADRPSQSTDRATAAEPNPKEKQTVNKTIAEMVARQAEIKARQEELDAEYTGRAIDGEADAEFKRLDKEWLENKTLIDEDTARKASIAAKAARDDEPLMGFAGVEKKTINVIGASTRRVPENIFALDEYRGRAASVEELNDLYHDGALRAIERASFPHPKAKQEEAQTHIEQLLVTHARHGHVSRRILATGSPIYERAFGKQVTGHPLSAQEQHALAVYGLQISSDPDGGFALPFTLDPTVVPTSEGAVNPYRQIANVKTTTTNQWRGVSSDGVEVAYDSEAAEVDDGEPTLAQPVVDCDKAHVFVRFTVEIDADWPAMRTELAVMIQQAKDRKEANKFTVGAGHGSNEPKGILTAIVTNIIPTVGAGLALGDVDLLDDALAPAFEPNAVWVANKAFYGAIRQLAGQTFDVWMPLAEGIDKRANGNTGRTLAGYPAWRCSEISSDLVTADSKVAVLGDFSRYFVIADRIGMTMEVVQHLFGENGRPTGERGLYGYFRNGSNVISEDAFQVLSIQGI